MIDATRHRLKSDLSPFSGYSCFVLFTFASFAVAVPESPSPPPTPVLLELFTSEGCSSCPPADDVLLRLATDQPIEGVRIIPLAFHVDYWNDLGWKDPFSKNDWTRRQQGYSQRIGTGRIHTPQLIVDGASEFVGSDERMARSTVATAVRAPKIALDVAVRRIDAHSVEVVLDAKEAAPKGTNTMVAITEDGLASNVTRGENAGRNLHHVAVVRSLRVAPMTDRRAAATITLDPEWKTANLNVVVFLQEKSSGRVIGAATARIPAAE